MLARCYNPKHRFYARYGGRGITVCDRWRSDFGNFLADMGRRPPGCSLDRRENDGNYEPGNCRWITQAEQRRNACTNRRITFRGETLILTDWAKRLGLSPKTLRARLEKGWPLERALTTGLLSPSETGRRAAAGRWGA